MGLELNENFSVETVEKRKVLKRFLNLRVIITHFPLLLFALEVIFQVDHITFLLSTFFDLCCFFITFNLLLHRKKMIICCLDNLKEIPCNTDKCSLTLIKAKISTVLLCATMVYVCIYFAGEMVVTIGNLIENHPITERNETLQISLEFMTIAYYTPIAYIGIPLQVVFFVHMTTLVHERLLTIRKRIDHLFKQGNYTSYLILQERIKFCKLLKLSLVVEGIFNEIVFLWITKIIVRTCLNIVDLLTRPWIYGKSVSTQIVVLLDVIFDIFHLAIVSRFGGNIPAGKTELQQSLIYNSAKFSNQAENLRSEMHYFMTVIGHSNVALSVANIIPLNRRLSLTIFGILSSYGVVIYQFTLN